MFAVLGPRLRQALKFGIGHILAQACLSPLFQNCAVFQIIPERFHLL